MESSALITSKTGIAQLYGDSRMLSISIYNGQRYDLFDIQVVGAQHPTGNRTCTQRGTRHGGRLLSDYGLAPAANEDAA